VCAPKDYLLLTDAQRRRSLHRFQDDTVFVDAMLADVKANYLVDTKRVYLAGFSNGAEMSSRLLVERSHVFAAIAIHPTHVMMPLPGSRSTRICCANSTGWPIVVIPMASCSVITMPITRITCAAIPNPTAAFTLVMPSLSMLRVV
jgi:poly(3-hydroxybutyrate) depolymerase